jgi:uncharacterized protein YndB with AHSA1/START domain
MATNQKMAGVQAEIDYALTVERIFDAPLELVWKAWTEPERLARWWGPKGFSMNVASLDFRPGGVFHYSIRSPQGQQMWGKFVYGEIQAPERMVFINSFSDEGGTMQRSPMSPTWPLEIYNLLTLEEAGGKTKLTLRGGPYKAGEAERRTYHEASKNVQHGLAGTFEQLDAYLAEARQSEGQGKSNKHSLVLVAEPGKHEIVMTRMFDAPPDLVFKVMTDPQRIPQWWGPRYLTTIVVQMEVRPGGSWRFVQHDPSGNEYAFHGVYHQVSPSRRLVYTFEFEGEAEHVGLETVTFEARDGKTYLIDQVVFQSVADRDGMLQSGMEAGAVESMERVDDLLR